MFTMSILTQVRRRCLSGASWRFDVRDGYGYFPHYQYHATNNSITSTTITSTTSSISPTTRNQKVSASCYKLIPSTCQNISNNQEGTCELKASNTPKIYHIRNHFLDRKYIRVLIKSADSLSSSQTEFKSGNFNTRIDPTPRSELPSVLTVNRKALLYHLYNNVRLILDNRLGNHDLLPRLKYLKNYTLGYNNSEHRIGGKSQYNEDQQDSSFRFVKQKASNLIPIVAILGLFKSSTEGDTDDEKDKLTDEQKMKKMKPVEIVIAKGVLSMTDQEYTKATQLFHEALRLAQDEGNEERETLVLNLLAANYYESGDFESAEKLFIDIMKRLINLEVEPTNPAILELSLKLASIYSRNQATHEKAQKGFKFVIHSLLNRLHDTVINIEEVELQDLSEDKRGELALLGWSYDWFAKHLIVVNDFNGAVDMLRKALQISLKVLGPLHQQTLILLNDVGTTLAMINEPDEGETFIKRAVEGAIESKSKELASFYVNLGLVNLKLKKLAEAKRYCEYSIELALKNREHHNSSEVIMLSQKCLNEVEQLSEVVN